LRRVWRQRTSLRICALLSILTMAVPGTRAADVTFAAELAERVLVVFNAQSRQSKEVADYYIAKRGIPASNKCSLKPESLDGPGNETIDVVAFDRLIKKPIQRCLTAVGKDKILYIVLAYDTPYKVSAGAGLGMAVDQYIADVWDVLPSPGRVLNPYYAHARAKAGLYPRLITLASYRARPESKTIYSVWRLDGASPALAKGLVDKALAAEAHGAIGQACFDRRFGDMAAIDDKGYGAGDWQLHRAAQFARAAGFIVVEDSNEAEFGTPPAPARCDDAILYAGWYSLNNYNDAFSWRPGAVGIHLDSASAANPRGGSNWSANAIKKGITVTAGAVDEPFLQGLPRPDGIIFNLLEGANVGDAFLRNTLWLKWMIINIGDPLYRPFAKQRGPFR
jgi:uncharacterized protein (TIGR03790 family)